MKNEAFIHQNQRVSCADAYSDFNRCPPVSAKSICETCTNLLESAYVFRQMCQVANQPIHNVCCCCLQEKSDNNDQYLNMENTVFEHNNRSVTFFEGYFYVNSLEDSAYFTNFDVSICKDCAMQLKSAYAFRRMCQKTAEILQQCIQLNSTNWISHNRNTKKSRKADKQRAAIKIKTDQRNLKSRRSHDIQQNIFSFICKKCPKTFKSNIRLSSHREIKHRDVRRTRDLYARVWKRKSTLRMSCEKCQIIFKTQESHSSHRTVRVPQQQDSDKVFYSSPGFNIFMINFPQKFKYRYKKCPKAFQTQYSLASHVHSEHLNISYDCKDCDKVFKTSAGLRQHKLGHIKSYKCEKCPKAYHSRTILLQHIQTKHENLRLSCQDCDKNFQSLSGLYRHKKTVHLKKLFKCKICDKIYKNPTSLSAHTNAKHLNKTFQCVKCSKVCHRREQFILHYRTKHLKKLFACLKCDKIFPSRSGLYSHKARIHLKILHQCEQCPKTFCDKGTLRTHVENIHEKKQFSCQDCKKVYKSPRGLSLHKNKIDVKKLLKCKNCEKTFTNLCTRDYHNRQDHLTFECQKCKKKLANKRTLAVHMQNIHPNDP
jgi:hypothetical protein